jgi:hypothetical protein
VFGKPTGVHKSEKKEVRGQPAVEARARAHLGRRPLPCQCGPGAIVPVWVH